MDILINDPQNKSPSIKENSSAIQDPLPIPMPISSSSLTTAKMTTTKMTTTKIAPNVAQLSLKERVKEVLLDIYDPEIPVNIYDLGLIYSLETNEEGEVRIDMTLTSPACPVAQTFPQTVQERVLTVANVTLVSVNLVWEPAWTRDRMSEAAKLQLNMF